MENLTPVEIVKVFDQYVYGQPMAKKMLAIALRNRIRVGQLTLNDRGSVRKQNLLLIGPTGSGKTALMRVLRTQFGLPVLEQDMTGFSETGYVGRNVNTIGDDLAALASSTPLPDWYVKLRTGMQLEQDKSEAPRYTADEWEAKRFQEYEAEQNAKHNAAKQQREAKKAHEAKLKSLGLFPSDEDYKRLQNIYYLRAFLVGYCAIKGIEYDDFDLRELELVPGVLAGDLARKAVAMFEKLSGKTFTGPQDFNQEDQDFDFEDALENNPALLGEFMGFMGSVAPLGTYLEKGLELLGGNPKAACVSGNDWFDVAYTMDGDKQNIPPGIAWRYFDDTGFFVEMALSLAWDSVYQELMEEFWSVRDFTDFADEKLWTFKVDTPSDIPRKQRTSVITKKELAQIDNCNGKDFVENFGVVFLDEFDKLIETDTTGRTHVSRSGVQRSLLKMVEGGLYNGINTTNVLFVAAGTFAEAPVSKLLPELQGRFSLRANLDKLDEAAIKAICRLPSSEFHAMIKLLKIEGVTVHYDDDTYNFIAEQTVEANLHEDLGARRLAAIVENIFQAALFEPEKYLGVGYNISGEVLRGTAK